MSPSRALAIALLAVLLLPLVSGQGVPGQPQPGTPGPVQCQAPVETCLPDLIPTNPRIDIRDERFPATACVDFVNLGEGPAATPFRITLLIDGAPAGERQANGVYQRGEGEANICWSDIMLSAGPHTMGAIVDSNEEVVESAEDNNERSISFRVRPEPRYDLRLTELRVTPKEGGPGMNQLFIVNITNIGDAGSPLSMVSLEDDHGTLANWSVPPLGPGQSWIMAHATRPEYRPMGTFIARAVVDPHNTLNEISELNNEALAEYTVLEHPAPDYNISKVEIVGNRTSMRGIRMDVVVDNIGDRLVAGTRVRVVDNAGNKTVAQGMTPSLIFPGGSATVQFYLVLQAGIYNLTLVADPHNEVAEHNESNNHWPLTVEIVDLPAVLDRPNLIVERIYAMPEDPRPGEAVSVGALVHNIGTNRSNATSVSFFVDDEPIGTAQIPSLAPDAYYSAYVPWVTTTQGSYRITASADHVARVVEIDESDNVLDLQFLVTTQRAPTQPPPPTQPSPVIVDPEPAPTPPTPTDPVPPTSTPTNEPIALGELIIATKPSPGGARGSVSLSLRNPNIQSVGLLTVAFKVDDKQVTEKLVQGIRGAATTAVTTGEIELPPGRHKVTAEVRVVGSAAAALVREDFYEQEAGPKEGIPAPAAGLLVALVVALALARRRR